ncbi:hypothetical protein BJ875DRAFT_481215 [Amylocarpus encephaloides]|uniref:Uncharacterized protein n=1 Tax=Amylocarpus encephaloides TaxID=45428 RepID=A0A9P7YPZ1_9HELO|nr:hypothetical protein BJ875DRAFT_481215 [Amylocarpus encephaloides]
MPSRELGISLDPPTRSSTTLLKKHKILPHPRTVPRSDGTLATPERKARSLTIDTGISSVSSSDTSSPSTLRHSSKKIGSLPPTPPTHSRQSSGNYTTSSTASNQYAAARSSSNVSSLPGTPTNQRSPPTPDVTPPRRIPSTFRPPVTDRYPSSRADSFKTALEDQDSSGAEEVPTVRPVLASAETSATEVPQVPKIPQEWTQRKEVGLGLGLESEGAITPKALVESPQAEFHVFDGEWGSESSEVEPEWDDNLMRNVTVRKRPLSNLQMPTGGAVEVLEDDIVSPTQAAKVVRGLPLQERIARHRKERENPNRSVSETWADRVPWPSAPGLESPTTPDIRRFSAMSARSGSTVIEAMVVDAPPSRRKTLRHTKKQVGLREFSSDQSTMSSAPNSVISSERPHRLHHATGKVPEIRHRSHGSNGTVSSTSSGKARREVFKNGGIPVVVIPDRLSSVKASNPPSLRSTSSRKTKRSLSLSSAPLSSSSKFIDPGHFGSLPPRTTTLSESPGSGHSIRTIDYPPSIPARRSSLSAPTSRDTSRAGSLTTESLHAHNMIQAKKEANVPKQAQSHRSTESHRDVGSHSSRVNVDHNGDPFFGKRLSTQVTPFSQYSYETAGTAAEVSEAMAVTIYPHQNKSLLVVQHSSEPSPTVPEESQKVPLVPPTMALNGEGAHLPVTPPQPGHPMNQVDSPLRNPRIPPEPPAIKFIPATPAALTPSQEEERRLGLNIDDDPEMPERKPKRGMSLMRKFSNRRNSEPTTYFKPGFLKRALSLSNRYRDQADEATQTARSNANPVTLYPSVEDRPADGSKLHPFWRPSHFWDDLEDEGFADDELVGSHPIIDNRPAPPRRSLSGKLKRTFAILPMEDNSGRRSYSTDRRAMRKGSSGNLRVVKQRSSSSLVRDGSIHRRPPVTGEGSFGYDFKEGNGGRVHHIPGIGVRVEYVGWGAMKRKLGEKRRQQRSEKLRASISHPKQVQDGMDDVLRRREMI